MKAALRTYAKRVSLDFKVEAPGQREATAEIDVMIDELRKTLPTGVSIAVKGRTQRADG